MLFLAKEARGLLTGICFSAPPAHESPVGVGWWGFKLTGICFSAPPAHESPVGVGWWGFNGLAALGGLGRHAGPAHDEGHADAAFVK
jgi:hypothetical protein